MTFTDATLVIGATAMRDEVTHMQLHSGARGAAGTTNQVGAAVAVSPGAIDADADITWANVAFTGLTANQAVAEVSYWNGDPAGAGVYRGGDTITGDATANSAGEYTLTEVREDGSAT